MDGDATDLSPEEVRVLGCLIEKEATVPDTYPLTLNSLRTACNQSTSRDPVVSYDDRTVEQALARLRERGLTRTVHSTSNRATKYRHVLPDVLDLDAGETALLCVLMLRGPQTVGELKTRTERQSPFDSTDAVAAALAGLAGRDRPLVRRLDRQAGQKDARWVHLLSPPSESVPSASPSSASASASASVPAATAGPARGDASTHADPYAVATAEFYDLLATAHWDEFGLELLDVLADVDPTTGPVVDVGSGTGAGLSAITAAVPGASIHAIEPSTAMRTALHARLALDPALRAAVTVDPRGVAAGLPERASAVVLSAVLGHLDDADRAALWQFVRDRLEPGAPVVVELLPPLVPERIEPVRYRSVRVGRFDYEGWQRGEPAADVDDRTMRWTMSYRVLDGDDLVAERSVTSLYRCWSIDELIDDVAPFGLAVAAGGESFVIVTHR